MKEVEMIMPRTHAKAINNNYVFLDCSHALNGFLAYLLPPSLNGRNGLLFN